MEKPTTPLAETQEDLVESLVQLAAANAPRADVVEAVDLFKTKVEDELWDAWELAQALTVSQDRSDLVEERKRVDAQRETLGNLIEQSTTEAKAARERVVGRTHGYPLPCNFCNDIAMELRHDFDDLVVLRHVVCLPGGKLEMKRHLIDCPEYGKPVVHVHSDACAHEADGE